MGCSGQLHAKRISIVIADLGKGGAQKVALDLCDHLQNTACCNVQLVTFSNSQSDELQIPDGVKRRALNLQIEAVGPLAKLIGLGRRLTKLRSAVLSFDSQLVIAFTGRTNIEAVVAMTCSSIPVIISERNDPTLQSLGAFWDRLRRLFYRRARIITANNPAAIDFLANFVPIQKLQRVYNPIHHDNFVLSQITLSKRLLAMGRLHPQKGYDDLIAAFAASKLPRTGWQLDILGDGILSEELKEQASNLGVKGVVHFHGWQQDTTPWLSQAEVFVMPSRYEGSPNALIEAMQAGLWCITSDAPGCAELIQNGRTGQIVPIGDRDSLTYALNACHDNRISKPTDHRLALQPFYPQRVYAVWQSVIDKALSS